MINEIGNHYGRLLVVERASNNNYGQARWLCRCDCGNTVVVLGYALRQQNTESCGCIRKEMMIQKNIDKTLHGARANDSEMPEYRAFVSAKGRCTNPRNKSYKDYGARGIQFRFTSFQQFLDEVGMRPSSSHSLDRIRNAGNYEPGNVRWADKKAQANNRRLYHETLLQRIAELEAKLALTNAVL